MAFATVTSRLPRNGFPFTWSGALPGRKVIGWLSCFGSAEVGKRTLSAGPSVSVPGWSTCTPPAASRTFHGWSEERTTFFAFSTRSTRSFVPGTGPSVVRG